MDIDLYAEILETHPENMDFENDEVLAWKQTTELAADAGWEYFKARALLLRSIFMQAKIMCFTVDGFLQTVTQQSWISKSLKKVKFKLAVLDEGHQVFHGICCAVAESVESLVVLFDRDQCINFSKIATRTSQSAHDSDAEYYPWLRSASGPSFAPVWQTVKPDSILHLFVQWRFGMTGCDWLNMTSPSYKNVKDGSLPKLKCPLHSVQKYQSSELHRVPLSRMRVVRYSRCGLYVSNRNGYLDPNR